MPGERLHLLVVLGGSVIYGAETVNKIAGMENL